MGDISTVRSIRGMILLDQGIMGVMRNDMHTIEAPQTFK